MFIFLVMCAGLLVSLSAVFLGIGGGLILVPLLPDMFGLSIQQAVATSITTIFFVVLVNTYKFHRQQLVDWPIVWLMGPTSFVTAFFAAQISTIVNPQLILIALAVILSFVAANSIWASGRNLQYKYKQHLGQREKVISLASGAIAGAASGFAGIGSGVILSPIMISLRIIEPIKLSPTSNANMLFATAAGTLGFLLAGDFHSWSLWGNIRLDIALGIFVAASVFSTVLRPRQHQLPFIIKAISFNLLLLFMLAKIAYMLFSANLK